MGIEVIDVDPILSAPHATMVKMSNHHNARRWQTERQPDVGEPLVKNTYQCIYTNKKENERDCSWLNPSGAIFFSKMDKRALLFSKDCIYDFFLLLNPLELL